MKTIVALVALLTACTVGDDTADDEPGDPEETVADPLAVEIDAASVAQVNPYYGGKYSEVDTHGPVTYRTAHRLGRWIADNWARVSVIGMEEMTSAQNATDLANILRAETGHPWAVQHFGAGTYAGALPSTQEAIFWRTDVWTPVTVFGTREVETIDTSRGPASYSVRFGGMLLQRNGTAKQLAMFAGKLTWLAQKRNGHAINNPQLGEEADTLMRWIDEKTAAYPNATRVIAVDLNSDYGNTPWERFRLHYQDGGDDRPTHWTYGARRIDGLFWDYDGGAKRSADFGILGGPYRSGAFGSDHRAIAARVRLK